MQHVKQVQHLHCLRKTDPYTINVT